MSQTLLDRMPTRAKSFTHEVSGIGYGVSLKSLHTPEYEWEDFYVPKLTSENYILMSWDTTPFNIQILDETFTLNHKLKGIYEEILESQKFLEYKDNWDSENAVGCNSKVYLYTIKLLVLYAEYVLKFYDIAFKVPEISLTRDGSFDIEWRCENRMFLMNIVNDEKLEVHFYGKDVNSTVLKGFLSDFEINREISHWMQKLI